MKTSEVREAQYYVMAGEQRQGPFNLATMQAKLRLGEIDATTLWSVPDATQWWTVAEYPLFDETSKQARAEAVRAKERVAANSNPNDIPGAASPRAAEPVWRAETEAERLTGVAGRFGTGALVCAAVGILLVIATAFADGDKSIGFYAAGAVWGAVPVLLVLQQLVYIRAALERGRELKIEN